MSKRVIAGQLVLLVLLLAVACKGRGLFRPSIESAKPLEIWEDGKPFLSAVQIIFEKKKQMQEPAFEKWLNENVKGRRIQLRMTEAINLEVMKCGSKCRGNYEINVGYKKGAFMPKGPFSLWTDDDKAISIPKRAKISFKGVISDVNTIFGISEVGFDLAPVEFEIIQ